ncbi:MAG: antibiotic biosynthesis monooxygenase [Gammaproteobacteria bacterium]|nr:antibiotic biosynthesis monooxygenase [Gammaproteobacteria bacterium]
MQVTIVHIKVLPQFIDSFVEACRLNHNASVRESGNLRFDVLQSAEDPQVFVLYEAYANESQAAQHKQTAHYRQWRDTVADWMAEPRLGVPYHGLFPA